MFPRITLFALALLLSVPAQAADFSWMDDKGTIHQLDEFSGKPVLLHLWASWCPPCRAEMPELTSWLKRHPEVTILPISLDNELADARDFLARHHFDLPTLLTDSSQAMRLGARGLPTTIVIDARGKVRQGFIGAQDWTNPDFSEQILRHFRAGERMKPESEL